MANVQFEDVGQTLGLQQTSEINRFSKPSQFLVRIGVVKTDTQAKFLMVVIGLVCIALMIVIFRSFKPDFSSIPEEHIIRIPGEPAFIRR